MSIFKKFEIHKDHTEEKKDMFVPELHKKVEDVVVLTDKKDSKKLDDFTKIDLEANRYDESLKTSIYLLSFMAMLYIVHEMK